MNNITKIIIVSIIVCITFGILLKKPVKPCFHEARLDRINFKETWRVNISYWTENEETEIGVCKLCGKITDIKATGDNSISHMPYPPVFKIGGLKNKIGANEEQYLAINNVLANWTVTGGDQNIEWVEGDITNIRGVENDYGRVIIVSTNGVIREIARWKNPHDNSVIILQGSEEGSKNFPKSE
jgi:hypothetical protein